MKLPEPFLAELKKLAGQEVVDDYLEAFGAAPPVSIRINPRKLAQSPGLTGVAWTDTGHYLPERPVFTADPLLHAGVYYVQEASSMVLEQVIRQHRPAHPVRVLDLCGAPGGKATHLLSLLNDDDLLVANEVIQSRVGVLSENITKWGADNVFVTHNDPRDFRAVEGFFDIMVVDAPCSGEGLFRKNNEAIREWSPENVHLCLERQQRIIADAWDSLSDGGILIYSTCTFNQHENEGVLRWLTSEYEVHPLAMDMSAVPGALKYEVGHFEGYKLVPGRVEGEGFSFFVVKKGNASGHPHYKAKKRNGTRQKHVPDVRSWIQGDDWTLAEKNGIIIATRFEDEQVFLQKKLRMIKSGLSLGEVKKNKVVPSHELAMSARLNSRVFPQIPLDYQQALSYLMNTTFDLPCKVRGYQLVTFGRVPLGWVNHLGNRFNNLYPNSWRIIQDFRGSVFNSIIGSFSGVVTGY